MGRVGVLYVRALEEAKYLLYFGLYRLCYYPSQTIHSITHKIINLGPLNFSFSKLSTKHEDTQQYS
jgi:hypothetical protein